MRVRACAGAFLRAVKKHPQIFSLFIFRCVRKNLCNTPKMPNNGNIGESSNKYSFEYGDT